MKTKPTKQKKNQKKTKKRKPLLCPKQNTEQLIAVSSYWDIIGHRQEIQSTSSFPKSHWSCRDQVPDLLHYCILHWGREKALLSLQGRNVLEDRYFQWHHPLALQSLSFPCSNSLKEESIWVLCVMQKKKKKNISEQLKNFWFCLTLCTRSSRSILARHTAEKSRGTRKTPSSILGSPLSVPGASRAWHLFWVRRASRAIMSWWAKISKGKPHLKQRK